MIARCASLMFLVLLAACSSGGRSGTASNTSPSSTAAVTRAAAPERGTTMRWSLDTVAGTPMKECGPSPEQCVLLATERGTFHGDLRGTNFTGSSTAFSKNGHFVAGRTDLFHGTVKGCGTGTLVFVSSELADLHGGTGSWRIVKGFGTGDLSRATGQGTGSGTVGKTGFHSHFRGVIDCGQ